MFSWKKALLLLILLPYDGKCQVSSNKPLRLEGRTMGTTYSIIYFDAAERTFQFSIDSILKVVNKGINNYDPDSEVSSFNNSTCGILGTKHFLELTKRSLEIAKASDGNFDPTVMPLVNVWGFGPLKNYLPTKNKIDSIRKFIGYTKVVVRGDSIIKTHPRTQLDFGGIGQGYAVDVIRDFMLSRNIENFLIELGGEGYAYGRNLSAGLGWRIGIINPSSTRDEQQLAGYALCSNQAFTTSGNYFNYRVIDGKKYGHTISPFTGFPVEVDLLSVTLLADNCIDADAWATALMVAGFEKSKQYLSKQKSFHAVLVHEDNAKPSTFITDRAKEFVFLDRPHDD